MIRPHDANQYWVPSRTRADMEHLVDLSDMENPECSCEAFMDFSTTKFCGHIESALAFHFNAQPKPSGGLPFAILSCHRQ